MTYSSMNCCSKSSIQFTTQAFPPQAVEWKQCQSCGLWMSNRSFAPGYWRSFEKFKKPPDVAGVVLWRFDTRNAEKEYYMVQCYGNKWGFPKGKCEGNETPSETASRELREETGYMVPPDQLHPMKTFRANRKQVSVFTFQFLCPKYKFPESDQEITGFGWVKESQLNRLPLSKIARIALFPP